MVSLAALWLPILLSAVFVFVASSIIHMVLPYHKSDYKRLPDEEKVLGTLRAQNLKRGLYHFPHCTHENMKTPEVVEKFKEGPVGFVIVMPSGAPNMGKFLGLWFGYCLLIAVFVAYLTGHTVATGAAFPEVFRVAGTTAFMSYGLAILANGIWKGATASNVMKEFFDGIIYTCLVGAAFGWLWPH